MLYDRSQLKNEIKQLIQFQPYEFIIQEFISKIGELILTQDSLYDYNTLIYKLLPDFHPSLYEEFEKKVESTYKSKSEENTSTSNKIKQNASLKKEHRKSQIKKLYKCLEKVNQNLVNEYVNYPLSIYKAVFMDAVIDYENLILESNDSVKSLSATIQDFKNPRRVRENLGEAFYIYSSNDAVHFVQRFLLNELGITPNITDVIYSTDKKINAKKSDSGGDSSKLNNNEKSTEEDCSSQSGTENVETSAEEHCSDKQDSQEKDKTSAQENCSIKQQDSKKHPKTSMNNKTVIKQLYDKNDFVITSSFTSLFYANITELIFKINFGNHIEGRTYLNAYKKIIEALSATDFKYNNYGECYKAFSLFRLDVFFSIQLCLNSLSDLYIIIDDITKTIADLKYDDIYYPSTQLVSLKHCKNFFNQNKNIIIDYLSAFSVITQMNSRSELIKLAFNRLKLCVLLSPITKPDREILIDWYATIKDSITKYTDNYDTFLKTLIISCHPLLTLDNVDNHYPEISLVSGQNSKFPESTLKKVMQSITEYENFNQICHSILSSIQ